MTSDFHLLSPNGLLLSSAIVPALCIIFLTVKAVYNIYFHPLRSFPGPKSFAATRISHVRSLLTGQLSSNVKDLHDEYGEIVRIAPDELSFNGPQAWRDIYGHRQGHKSFVKDYAFFGTPLEGVHSIITTPSDADHSRMRRLLAHAFSEKALREQEPLITSYIDLLISKLHQQVQGPNEGKVDIVRWYNYTTFDIIGDLAFGEAFGCLKNKEYHSWVAMIFQSVKYGVYLQAARRFPSLTKPLEYVLPRSLKEKRMKHTANNKAKVLKRLKLGKEVDRPDFISYILRHNDEKGMSEAEILSSAATLIIAGSETTATLLSGTTFHLLSNPETYKKLVNEVRATFKNEDEINSITVNKLKYLQAVLEEGLRIYPPVPCTIARKTPREGDEICGRWIPGNTSVGVNQWAAYQSPTNFARPTEFIPERWLPSAPAEFASDRKSVLQPFSTGPRNCIGRNLAYMEMRIILARIVWNFDLELCEESMGWEKQKVYTLWEKGPLTVRLAERV
ncbi:MAG: hypothetical protein M1830_008463 [Pleopsidium flavum]|nr:MAG: hypothetical protein M1830_008463 [Pleopsidium flavum]